MALTYQQLATHTETILSAVSGVGVIYTTPKDFREISEIEENCVLGTPARLNVWMISRKYIRNSLRVSDGRPVPLGQGARLHNFIIKGWYGYIPDAETDTYVTFQSLCDSLADTFQGKKQRSSTAQSPFILDTDEVVIEPADELVEFGDAFICHYVEISIVYNEMYTVSYI